MLKIKIGNTLADTREVEIPVTLRSPLFLSEGRITGSFLFNFQLPNTDAMKSEIGFIHRPARYGVTQKKKTFYLEFGALKYSGECNIVQASDSTIEVNAPINTGSLATVLKELKMSDIDMGGMRNPLTDNLFNFKLNCIHDNGYITFRIYVNSILRHTYPLNDGSNIFSFDLHLTASDVVTWDILAESQGSPVIQDEETIYWSLSAGSSIEIVNVLHAKTTVDIVLRSANPNYFTVTVIPEFLNIVLDINGIINIAGTQVTGVIEAIPFSTTAQYPEYDFALFPLENPLFMDNYPDDIFNIDHLSIKEVYTNYYPILNYFRDGKFPTILTSLVGKEAITAYNLFCPFPYVAFFIKKMFAQLNITLVDNVFEGVDLKQLVIYNAFVENEFISNNLIKMVYGFDLANHVPDEKLSDFLNEICKLLGIALDYNSHSSVLRFANLKDIATDQLHVPFPGIVLTKPFLKCLPYKGYSLTQKSTGDSFVDDNFKSLQDMILTGSVFAYWDLPLTPATNDIYYVQSLHTYYLYTYNEESATLGWVSYSLDFDHVFTDSVTDEGELFDITSEWSAVMDYYGYDNSANSPGRAWKIPRIDQPGNFEGMPKPYYSVFSKCLLFYRGVQLDSMGNLYPLGTHSEHSWADIKIDGADLSLCWNGDYGLWEKRHRRWVEWIVSNPGIFTFKAFLTPLQLSQINWFKWTRILDNDFLIKEIRFNIYDSAISEIELDALKR